MSAKRAESREALRVPTEQHDTRDSINCKLKKILDYNIRPALRVACDNAAETGELCPALRRTLGDRGNSINISMHFAKT